MAYIYEIQCEIINKLKTDITDLKIEKFNKLFEEFLSPTIKGKISVELQGIKFGDPQNYDKIKQGTTFTWKLLLVVRNFPEISEDTYAYIETILESLAGYKILSCDSLYCSSVELKNTKEDKYYYELIFTNKTQYYN
jgi:hypothetical protein